MPDHSLRRGSARYKIALIAAAAVFRSNVMPKIAVLAVLSLLLSGCFAASGYSRAVRALTTSNGCWSQPNVRPSGCVRDPARDQLVSCATRLYQSRVALITAQLARDQVMACMVERGWDYVEVL